MIKIGGKIPHYRSEFLKFLVFVLVAYVPVNTALESASGNSPGVQCLRLRQSINRILKTLSGHRRASGQSPWIPSTAQAASRTPSWALAAPTSLTAPVYGFAKTWGGNASDVQANHIVVDGSGNLYVTGEYSGAIAFNPAGGSSRTSNGAQDVFLSKFSPDGTFQWVRTWGGTGRDVASGIALDSSGNVYASGHFTYCNQQVLDAYSG